MGAPSPVKKARPKFKLEQFRDVAIESKSQEVGVDLDLDAGVFDPREHDTIADTSDFTDDDVVRVDDGDVVHVPHPLMLDDPHQEAFDKFNRREDVDQVDYIDEESGEKRSKAQYPYTIGGAPAPSDTYRMAAAIIGERELWRLLAGGGHSNDVALAWEYLTRDTRMDRDPKAQRPPR